VPRLHGGPDAAKLLQLPAAEQDVRPVCREERHASVQQLCHLQPQVRLAEQAQAQRVLGLVLALLRLLWILGSQRQRTRHTHQSHRQRSQLSGRIAEEALERLVILRIGIRIGCWIHVDGRTGAGKGARDVQDVHSHPGMPSHPAGEHGDGLLEYGVAGEYAGDCHDHQGVRAPQGEVRPLLAGRGQNGAVWPCADTVRLGELDE